MSILSRLLAVLMSVAPLSALAQGSVPQPLRWIVPYAAGGATDTLVRTLAEAMARQGVASIAIDNRPGASTNIGVQALLQSAPDGRTLMHAENAALFFNEHMFRRLPYKPERDFTYIAAIGRMPVALVVHPSFPARTLSEFVAHARAHPGKVDYASPGIGTSHHMAMEMLAQRTGIKVNHIVYKGGAPAVQDVLGGQVPVMMIDLTVGYQYIRAGRLRPLAIASTRRAGAMPNVPTFIESGVQDMTAYTVHGLIGPARMPPTATLALNVALQRAVRDPKVQSFLADTGFEPLAGRPEEFKALARSESARWGRVIEATGVTLD